MTKDPVVKFSTPIPDDDRAQLSLPSPPHTYVDGSLRRKLTLDQYERYEDMAGMKERNTVYVDEELDVYGHGGSLTHYVMTVRCMPWAADLRLILRAAQAMQLIGDCTFSYEQREGLSQDLVSGYWDIRYSLPRISLDVDADTTGIIDVYVPYAHRRRVWMELFEAMGHHVKWGSRVLNVKKR